MLTIKALEHYEIKQNVKNTITTCKQIIFKFNKKSTKKKCKDKLKVNQNI